MGEKKDEKKVKVKPRRVEVQYGAVDDEITLQLSVYAEGAEEPTHQDTLEVEISGVSSNLVPVYIEDRIVMVMDDSGLYEESKGDEADEESKVCDEIRFLVALCRQMLDRAARYPTRRIAVQYAGTGPDNLRLDFLIYGIGMRGPRRIHKVTHEELCGPEPELRGFFADVIHDIMDVTGFYETSERDEPIRHLVDAAVEMLNEAKAISNP